MDVDKPVAILLVGIGGYGNGYVDELLNYKGEEIFKIAGAVDPAPEKCKSIEKLKKLNVPIYQTMEEFYAEHQADLAVISSPIQFHSDQTCLALSHGSNVLCEKPVSATVEEALKMIKARDQAGKFVGIGYQWSFSEAISSLKQDILAGKLGRARSLKTIVLWPRDFAYYNRSSWAGKIRDQKGNWILDSVANNATAHFLHNMFYVLGEKTDRSAVPLELNVELYRANQIENYDTAAIRIKTREGADIIFLATHATKECLEPSFCFEFDKATVYYDEEDGTGEIRAVFKDGTTKHYGDPFLNRRRKLWICIDAVRNGTPIPCGIEAALSHTVCINGAQKAGITNFPAELVVKGEKAIYVKGLGDVIKDCYERQLLPSEVGASWAKPASKVNLEAYLDQLGW